ncbi:MAG TPA: hypothetical protein VKB47_18020, partial [Terracidiphilus sp.]|nr:hypothetical protein [Terracidiphilus sp.]
GALNQRRIALLAQYGGGLARESDIVGLSMTHQDLARRSDVLQGQHDAEEAAKAAVQKQIESSQELLAAIHARTTMTAKAEADFWQAIAATDAKGGLLRTEATKRANLKLGEQMQQDAAEKSARIIAGARDNEAMQEHISDALYETMVTNQRKLDEGDQKAQQAAIEAFKKGEQERLDAERVAEDHIRAQMASGGLSRLEGAQAIAALHAQGAAAWQQSNQSFRNAFPDVSTPGAAGTMTRISIQAQADQRALETARTLSALKDSAQHLASEFTDTAAIVSDLLVTSLKSFNDTLVHILTARSGSLQGQHPFKQLGAGIFGDIAKYGLQELEGQLLKLVLGKNPLAKLGTIGNPMHAIIDAFGPGAAGGGAGGAIGSGAGGVIGGVLGAAMSFLPGYADGGPVSTNMPILVGENGPEIFQPTTSGRIVPNHSIGSSGATIHVDARGAGDPAAVEAAVHRSMRAYIPAMAQLARGAVADDRKRTPSRLRGR